MKFIKLFNNHSDYNTYISSNDKILPNLSYCKNENETHLNPWVETKIVAKYNVASTSEQTQIISGLVSNVSKMYIDDIEQSSVVYSYTFDTIGEHTIKYELIDNTILSPGAFYHCTSLTSVTIPNSVTTIDQNAFSGCSGLTSITIPNSVTTIGQGVFNACSGLTNITISNNVTTIGDGAFYYCTSLTSVTIPNSVTTIGAGVFGNCNSLTSVIFQATTPPTLLGNNAFDNTNNCPIYVPSASVEAYKAATNWSSYASRIQAIP